ncbi:hypothetical protein [Streptomyces sp. NPDC059783]|uniref:hypothetical protein n=1 Tax=Streptomyces sp. NPDC059783 TaxID=3346944 RepID=UPI00364B8016
MGELSDVDGPSLPVHEGRDSPVEGRVGQEEHGQASATNMYDALFDAAEDDRRSRRDWARSDTHSGSAIWSGRPDFRRRVLEQLLKLTEQHPGVLVRSLPRLVDA